jgi:S1-C subfamily serine protease
MTRLEWLLRFKEKGQGKRLPVHHKLEELLDQYLKASGAWSSGWRITVKRTRENGLADTFTGTGFIVGPAGYVLTCNHVIPKEKSDYVKIESRGLFGGQW